MGIQADIIIPPIIIALLIIMIFRVNVFIMESSADNRLNNDMQTLAETAATVLQEEIKVLFQIIPNIIDNEEEGEGSINAIEEITIGNLTISNTFQFINFNQVNVRITREERNIVIERCDEGDCNTEMYALNLSDLQFIRDNTNPNFVRLRVRTESQPEHHVHFRNNTQTVQGFDERNLFLRNLALP